VLVVVVCSSILIGIQSPVFASPPNNGENLFIESALPGNLDQSSDATVIRTRFVNVNLPLLSRLPERTVKGATLTLNLFADTTLTAVLDHIDPKSNGMIWVGHVDGVKSSTVTLVTEGDIVAGNIVMPGSTFAVRYAGGNVHAINQIDQSAFAPELPPLVPTLAKTSPSRAPADLPFLMYLPFIIQNGSSSGNPAIDVMVLYTPGAQSAAGGAAAMTARVNLGISETNTSYQNSGINQRINLVYAGLVNYTETGTTTAGMSTDLNNVTNGNGALSVVPGLRNTYKADFVSLWETGYNHTGGACGIGWFMSSVSSSFAPYAYNIVDQSCVSPNYSYAHEMGHNMGVRHDWYVDSGVTPYTYAHGYVYTPGKWRTIMAYNDLCSAQSFNCLRLLYWANPDVSYGGVPMGVAAGTSTACTTGNQSNPLCDADDHRTLNNTAATVAGFR
jgi:hypothetical protein